LTLGDRIEASAAYDSISNRICVGSYDGIVYCLDRIDGHICWKFQTEDQIKCTAVCFSGHVFVGSHDKQIYCIDIDSGRLIWTRKISDGSIFSSPALSLNRLLVATLDGTVKTSNASTVCISKFFSPCNFYRLSCFALYLAKFLGV